MLRNIALAALAAGGRGLLALTLCLGLRQGMLIFLVVQGSMLFCIVVGQ